MPDSFEQKTIRDHLLGMVINHLAGGQINCGKTQHVGCELAALLSAYREEERRLFPQVYLLGPSDSDLIRVLSPGAWLLGIGAVADEGTAQAMARKTAITALKSCAALAIDGWSIYIRRDNGGFSFGLLRSASESYSAGAEATLAASGLPAALLRNSAENTIEILNSAGGRLEISLTTASPSQKPMSEQIVTFSKAVCAEVTEESRDQACSYFAAVLTDFLRASHGALLGVTPFRRQLDKRKLSDGVILGTPVPLVTTMLNAMTEQSLTAASLLRSHESLLRGMIMSDGVTILGSDGSIRAFRMFVNAGGRGANVQAGKPSGGARSRAFEVLRGWVGNVLTAALFRSQDGRTEVVVPQ